MGTKDIEGFFSKISGNRRGSIEKPILENDTSDNRPLSGDLISSVKIDPFQQRSPSVQPIANISKQHKLRRAILQVFEPLIPTLDISEKNEGSVPTSCGKILERYNMECGKDEKLTHLEAKLNYDNVLACINPLITASSTFSSISNELVNIPEEELSSEESADQSLNRTVIEVNPGNSNEHHEEILIDLSYVDIQERRFSEDICNGAKVSFAATSLLSQKMSEKLKALSPRYSEDPIREKNILNMQLKVENEIYHEKIDMINEENEIIEESLEDYAKQLENKLVELTSLKTSYDQMKMHFIKLQDAFTDVYIKFDNAKSVIKGLQCNEQHLMQNLLKVQEEIRLYTMLYGALYSKLIKEVNELNSAVLNNRKVHKRKMEKLQTTLNNLEEKELSVEKELIAKTSECQHLARICKNASSNKR